MALKFPLPPPTKNMSQQEMFLLMEAWQRLITRWFYKVYDLGDNISLDSSNKLSPDIQGWTTDHGTLDAASLLDDDHTQYMTRTDLASVSSTLGSFLTGFADPNGETTHATVQAIIASLLTWAIANGYTETIVGTGGLVFNNSENSHHLGTVA